MDDRKAIKEIFAQQGPILTTKVNKKLIERSQELAKQANAFHWPLMFHGIFTGLPYAGFDVLLGNPPLSLAA